VVEAKIDKFDLVKMGEIEPERCGKCEYCKQTKRLTAPSVFEPEEA
jgi:MinD superfamily P-loop ATPase